MWTAATGAYLYPPMEQRKDDPAWTFEAWDWMLREALGLPCIAPSWLNLPAMMRVTLSTPLMLDRLNYLTRPYNFLFCPLVMGYPTGVDRDAFTLITPFTKRHHEWLDSRCVNVRDGRSYRLALQQTAALDRVIPQTFGSVLRLYLCHRRQRAVKWHPCPSR
jgi:hypothetical protein